MLNNLWQNILIQFDDITDILVIINYVSALLVMTYFWVRIDRINNALLEQRTRGSLTIVLSVIGGIIAVITNGYLSSELDWFLVRNVPQTSLLFGMLFGLRCGLLTATATIAFQYLLFGVNPSEFSLTTFIFGAVGGGYNLLFGRPWENYKYSIGFVCIVYLIGMGSLAFLGRYNDFDAVQLPIVFIASYCLKVIIVLGILLVVANYMKKKKQFSLYDKISGELQLARKLQFAMTGIKTSKLPDKFDIASKLIPAREVGGDWFNVIKNEKKKKVCVIAGDVADKGISAALYMATISNLFIFLIKTAFKDIASVFNKVNAELVNDNPGCMFATAVGLEFDCDSMNITYVSAGHIPILLRKSTGEIVAISTNNKLALGLITKRNFMSTEIKFEDDDEVIVMTDGIIEARSEDGELFGLERVKKSLIVKCDCADDRLKILMQSLNNFTKGAQQNDDIAVVVIRANLD